VVASPGFVGRVSPVPHLEILEPTTDSTVPLVVHVPHSSVTVPSEIRRTFAIGDAVLATELLLMTDRFTDELAEPARALGATIFVNRLSRLVMDPERFPRDADEWMANVGMGAVYLSRQDGSRLRSVSFPDEERDRLITSYYRPYHDVLEDLIARQVAQSGCCLIVDLHSFPKKGLPYEKPDLARPQVCIGFDRLHVDEALRDRWAARIRREGLEVGFNSPFTGSLVPSRYYGRDRRVRSLMLELRRDLYMDEATGEKSSGFERTRSLVESLLVLAAGRCSELASEV
jgi:N-formylglutamate deformylase